MREIARMVSVLFTACGLSAASLAVVNMVTRERIARWEHERQENALRAVMGDADEFAELTPGTVWDARSQGQKVGSAYLTRIQGYSGPITLMFGVDNQSAITGVEVLSHTETPGLGAKIVTPGFRDVFKGKHADQLKLRKDDPGLGQIDAITGATISSRAVTKALRTTLESSATEKGGDLP